MRQLLFGCILLLGAVAARAEVIDIDNAELARLLKQGVPIVDIRLAAEWEETGIIAGSHLLTFFDEHGRHNAPAWLDKLKPIAKPGEPVILICRTGNRTRAVSQFLSQQAGYRQVYNVGKGIRNWIASGAPVIAAGPALTACRAAKTC